MNGAHDLGGMQDLGPVPYEKNEPVFHQRWEGRMNAMDGMLRLWGKWNMDTVRWIREKIISPADYYRMSYYERRYVGVVQLLLDYKLATSAELRSGKPEKGSPKLTPPLTADQVVPRYTKASYARGDMPGRAPRFLRGQRVRSLKINPIGHTRLPRYARGRVGIINSDHGVFVFPDTNATFLGTNPQHVYSVRFDARELWGEQARPQDAVYLDMWDDYLEPA